MRAFTVIDYGNGLTRKFSAEQFGFQVARLRKVVRFKPSQSVEVVREATREWASSIPFPLTECRNGGDGRAPRHPKK